MHCHQRLLLAIPAFCVLLAGGSAARAAATVSTLATFTNANGADPNAGLVADQAGNLYGTTRHGGPGDYGTLFEFAPKTHLLTTLVRFSLITGIYPQGGPTFDSAGILYGTTSNGFNGYGGVFEMLGGVFNPLFTLGQPLECGLLADSAGNLYGTTTGTNLIDPFVFKVLPHQGVLTLATFTGAREVDPQGALIADSAGNLYGTTSTDSSGGPGSVFEYVAANHSLSTLVAFNKTNGANPLAGLVADAAGNMYGTTTSGGASGLGTVYRIAAGTHAFSTVINFGGTNGANPDGKLIIDAAGNLFGTTSNGGANNQGFLFEIKAGTNAVTPVVSFNVFANGAAHPSCDLVADAAGNLYGTEGVGQYGGVFEAVNTGFVPTPEPSAVSLIAVAGLGLLARRSRVGALLKNVAQA